VHKVLQKQFEKNKEKNELFRKSEGGARSANVPFFPAALQINRLAAGEFV
jgi:hypothetical protein